MINCKIYEQENINYWTERTSGYSGVNQDELSTSQHSIWRETILRYIKRNFGDEQPKKVKVLDVGTGPGFFAIILAELGYSVTAVDYTKTMLEAAEANAGALAEQITFMQMNAENLTFVDNSFDMLVSRNLTWNLYHPEAAYHQWCRVLKPGGLLLNFDANWYRYLHDDTARKGHLLDKMNVIRMGVSDENNGTDVPAMEAIAYQAPLSAKLRPVWDIDFLTGIGMEANADCDIWKRVWTLEEKVNNASTPMFAIQAIKPATI